MDTDLLFRIILGILFVTTIANIELIQDRDNPRHIALPSLTLTLVNVAIIAHLINPDWLTWSTLPFPDWLSWLGVVRGILGVALLWWTHRTLGSNFFGGVKLRRGHALVIDGPYRRARHPMYIAMFLIGVAYFFLSTSWLIGLPWMAAIVATAATRVKQVEEMLADQFGDQYPAYQSRTGRFLPRLR
jgi:protein-S-isoprenylcysteine O-methyltransferase Ste14